MLRLLRFDSKSSPLVVQLEMLRVQRFTCLAVEAVYFSVRF